MNQKTAKDKKNSEESKNLENTNTYKINKKSKNIFPLLTKTYHCHSHSTQYQRFN